MTTTPQLEQLDPKLLTTEHNVRKDLHLTKDFVKSIKQSGVLEPIIAFPDPLLDGHYRVHIGHRRAAAAVEAGLGSVLVMIITEREASERIAEQLVENQHRTALRPDEVAGAFEQLTLFGMSAMQIAKRTSTPLAKVGDAITVAKNPAAAKAIAEHQVTIEDALVFNEFADDEEALAKLTEIVETKPEQLAHQAQLIRNDRADIAARQAVIDEIIAKGIVLLDQAPGYDDKDVKRIHEMRDAPGWTGKQVPEDTVLYAAGDDLRAWPSWGWARDDQDRSVKVWSIDYGVTNWRDHGWHLTSSPSSTKGPLSDEEKDERRLARENGKLFLAAGEVRRAWVKKFLERRTLPTDWPVITALVVANVGSGFHYNTRSTAADMIGVSRPDYANNTLAALIEGNTAQAPHFLLTMAIAELEGTWDEKQGWKNHSVVHPLYLRQLSAWGYTLSDIEEHVVVGGAGGDSADV